CSSTSAPRPRRPLRVRNGPAGRAMKRRPSVIGVAAALAWALTGSSAARAAETLPPTPNHYFSDYANVVSSSDAHRIDEKLRRFDEESSNQVLVVVFPELPSASMEDFTARAAQSWRVGRKKLDNGVVLFVFIKDRKMRIEVGYGLEGALPDATANGIIRDVMAPRFRQGDYGGGLDAAVDAIIAATRGEYQAAPHPAASPQPIPAWVFNLLIILILFVVIP